MISRLSVPFRPPALALGLAFISMAVAASAQELPYRDGRFLETLGGVTIQRVDEATSDEAVRNMPFLPGDRVWTDESGRAEIVFTLRETLWIAERSKVDSLGRGGRDQDDRLGLRVFAGSFGARVHSGGPGFEFRAPGGSITTTGAAAFRVDVRAGETVLSVSEGEVLSGLGAQRMTVRGGERVRYADGRVDGPFRYQRASGDRFDRWCEERSAELNRVAINHNRLPDELDAYGDELDQNGDWVYDEPSGYVYVPRVAYNWSPYTYGRWVYTFYGWTWVADEPWGFVTSHYGRWGYSPRIGWHWLPRLGFSGAWVGWSSPGGRWNNAIGWCALGFNDRPVSSLGRGLGRGDSRSTSPDRGWSYANRSDLGRANAHRRRVEVPADEAAQAVAWSPGTSPDREFRETKAGEARHGSEGRGGRALGVAEAAGAISRGEGRGSHSDTASRIYVRPSPGDSTPELQSDPMTTIPTPESRRRRTIGQDGFKDEQDGRKNRTRPESTTLSIEGWVPSPSSESARQHPSDPGKAESPSRPKGDSAGTDSGSDRSTRDPLLSRFFRSITRPSSEDRESSPPRDGSSALRKDPPPRDDSSAKDNSPKERARPSDENRERARPSGGERPQPRNSPPPRASPEGGSSDEHATKRRPQQER